MFKSIKYYIRRKTEQIKRLFKWIPVIWNQYDFDYSYSLEVFKLKLSEQADFLESDRSNTMSAKSNAKRIRTAIELMDRVYSDYYIEQYIDMVHDKYGERGFIETELIDKDDLPEEMKGEKLYETELIWLRSMTDEEKEEAEQYYTDMINLGRIKQNRASILLWKFIEHNIENWWD